MEVVLGLQRAQCATEGRAAKIGARRRGAVCCLAERVEINKVSLRVAECRCADEVTGLNQLVEHYKEDVMVAPSPESKGKKMQIEKRKDPLSVSRPKSKNIPIFPFLCVDNNASLLTDSGPRALISSQVHSLATGNPVTGCKRDDLARARRSAERGCLL